MKMQDYEQELNMELVDEKDVLYVSECGEKKAYMRYQKNNYYEEGLQVNYKKKEYDEHY